MAFNLKVEVIESSSTGLTIKLRGELDQLTIKDVNEKLQEMNADKALFLTFDLGELEFMASAGLSIFAYYHDLYKNNAQGQQMKIINCQPAVMRIFKLTKMDEILTIV